MIITVPVKCSIVERLDKTLAKINLIEAFIIFYLAHLYIISYWYSIRIPLLTGIFPDDSSVLKFVLSVVFFICLFCAGFKGDVYLDFFMAVYSKLPSLECIKDDN